MFGVLDSLIFGRTWVGKGDSFALAVMGEATRTHTHNRLFSEKFHTKGLQLLGRCCASADGVLSENEFSSKPSKAIIKWERE